MRKPKERPAIIFRKQNGKPVPVSQFDEEQWQASAEGTEFDLVPRTKRSNPQNRLYWQLLSNVIKACGSTMPPHLLHSKLKERLGYTFLYTDLDGTLKEDVDSTAFDNMPPHEFGPYMDAAMKELAELAGFDPLETLKVAA